MQSGEHDQDITRTHIVLGKGTEIGHYRIIEKIGAGGMGEVYLAEDSKLNRQVALKFLPAHLSQDPDVRLRFTREAQAVAKLDHPNIVTIHEVGEFNGRPFLAMQYVDGKTLTAFCHDEPLAMPKIVSLILQISEGLAKAHGSGVFHRDIKSANIIVDKEFRPKILDFGLASIQGGEMLTKAGSTLGTVAYMSPEQAQGWDVDYRSDLFSLGIVMYEMIAGKTPFKRNSDAATLHAIVSEAPDPLSRFKSDVTPEIQRIVTKSLAKNPDERYQSAADLAADLRTVERMLTAGGSGSSLRVATLQPSIAVLPFANMSADPENEYFSDGLTEELLNILAKNPALKVTGRTSSFAFKGKQEDLRTIGQKLGVQTLLEGSVRRAGARVRITAQLVNSSDGFHLWSETYDRVLDDIFAVQDEIASSVAKALHVTLFGQPAVLKAVNPESYALVLRAQQSALQMTGSGLAVAADLYRKAIELDVENARAWAGLGLTLAHMVAYGHADYRTVAPKAREAAERALLIDESLADGHEALGFVQGALELRLAECGISYRRALELAPNDSRICCTLSIYEGLNGRFDEALRLSDKAVELDPLNPTSLMDRGRLHLWANRLSEAQDVMRHALELSPGMTSAHVLLGWVLLMQGKLDQALAEMKLEKLPGYRNCGLTMLYHAQDDHEKSDQALAELLLCGDQWAVQFAAAYAFRGEIDKAFDWLDRAWELRDSGIPLARVHPFLRNLHGDPRWPLFLKKVGL